MLLKTYKMLGYPLIPFVIGHTAWRAIKGKEDPKRLAERRGIASVRRPDSPVIWIHAASVGESNAVRPLVEALLERYPRHHILLTTTTRTSADLIKKWQTHQLIHQYLPYDLSPWVQRFLRYWQPNLVLFAESELWPTTLMALKARAIPTVLLNGCLSKTSYQRWSKAPGSILTLLNSFVLTYVPNQEQNARFIQLGAKKLKILPNLKFASPPLSYDKATYQAIKTTIGKRLVYVAASLHSEDYPNIMELHDKVLKPRNVLTILVPRHPNKPETFACVPGPRRSTGAQLDNTTDIYIADTFGELGLWYKLADLVYIGGSSESHMGGHNPLEPARLGCAIQFGPGMKSFSDISANLVESGGAFCAKTPQMHLKNTLKLIEDSEVRDTLTTKALELTTQSQSVLATILNDLKPYLIPIR